MDPNADPTPAELTAWRIADVAAAETWAAGRLERAHQLGDVEIIQHLGNLLAEVERLRAVADAAWNLRDMVPGADQVEENRRFVDLWAALDAE